MANPSFIKHDPKTLTIEDTLSMFRFVSEAFLYHYSEDYFEGCDWEQRAKHDIDLYYRMVTLLHVQAKFEAGKVASSHAPDFPFGEFGWVRFPDGTVVDLGAKYDRARENRILVGNPPKLKGWDMVYGFDPDITTSFEGELEYSQGNWAAAIVHVSVDELILEGYEEWLANRS